MIKYIDGDIFASEADVILHQVNCQGVMGSGVAKQVRARYPWVYGEYKALCDMVKATGSTKRLLGVVRTVYIDESRQISNLFAQDRYGSDGKCYTDYGALRQCLETIDKTFKNKTIAIPYLMGCHRGGGDWETVLALIEDTLCNCEVTIYKFNGG